MISRNVSGDSGDHDNGDLILFPNFSSNDSMCKLLLLVKSFIE